MVGHRPAADDRRRPPAGAAAALGALCAGPELRVVLLDRADFPSDGPALVEAALDHRAPDAVVAELERLPEGETYERIGDVVRALGYSTET